MQYSKKAATLVNIFIEPMRFPQGVRFPLDEDRPRPARAYSLRDLSSPMRSRVELKQPLAVCFLASKTFLDGEDKVGYVGGDT